MKRVLLLGGNGFIGSHVLDELLGRVHVRVFDRSPVRFRAPCSGVEYYTGSLDQTEKLAQALTGVDAVLHAVSTTVPGTSNLDPSADVHSNLIGTIRLFDLMVRQKVGRIVFLSSGGTVYGEPRYLPVDEDHPLLPICSYGVVKAAIEDYLRIYERLHGLSHAVFRISNAYGPRQGKLGVQGAVATFFQRILNGEPIEIWGDGEIRRDYVYVGDVAAVIARTLCSDEIRGTFNLAYGTAVSLLELITSIEQVAGRKANVSFRPARLYDVREICLNTAKAKQAFGWQPTRSLEQGLRLYYDWLKSV
jgi:UDP-glucose 4-epimerase